MMITSCKYIIDGKKWKNLKAILHLKNKGFFFFNTYQILLQFQKTLQQMWKNCILTKTGNMARKKRKEIIYKGSGIVRKKKMKKKMNKHGIFSFCWVTNYSSKRNEKKKKYGYFYWYPKQFLYLKYFYFSYISWDILNSSLDLKSVMHQK